MESELVQAIQEIAQGLNQTSCFDILSLIISAISACATVAVLYYNHRTIKLAQDGMQQSLNLAFYEKMLAVANNIENTLLPIPFGPSIEITSFLFCFIT